MRFGTPDDIALPDERANFNHLVRDMAWFGLALAATSRFLSIYAIRLGATPLELGLIASLPAIVLLFSSGLGGWWMRRVNHHPVKALFLPGIGFRFLFLLPALAPFLPPDWQPAWLIASVAVPAIPQGIASVAFMVLMRQAIEDRFMSRLISRRMVVLNVTVGAAALAFGFWLEQMPFPVNYQAMFVLAFVFALMSERNCLKIRCILPVKPDSAKATGDSPWRSPRFLRVVFVIMVSHIAFTSILPITPLRMMHDLGATEGFMALFGLAELVAGAMISLVTSRVVGRIGNQAMIGLAMIGTAVAALVLALAPSLPITLVAAAISGASWTAATTGVFGLFMQSAPAESMTRYSVAYQQMVGLALFAGPMIGSTLVNSGAQVVIVVLMGAALRLVAGAMIEYGVFGQVTRTSRAALTAVARGVK